METFTEVNGSFVHPFTCVVAGPSGSGKTTFVRNLLESPFLIDTDFKHITIYLGTRIEDNQLFKQYQSANNERVNLIDYNDIYPSQKEFANKFAHDFRHTMQQLGPGGCVIFDDMMQDLASANLISDLFSKLSSHLELTVIHITQNIFFRGKQPQEHRTLYNNTQHLVLFPQKMDTTQFRTIAGRLSRGSNQKASNITDMMFDICAKFRYVIINGGIEKDNAVKFTSDIFNADPFPFQRCFKPL